MSFLTIPGLDEEFNLPPEVRRALAASPEFQRGGGGRLNYTASGWPARPDSPEPQMWVSTLFPAAPAPSDWVRGDMWIRDPAALEQL